MMWDTQLPTSWGEMRWLAEELGHGIWGGGVVIRENMATGKGRQGVTSVMLLWLIWAPAFPSWGSIPWSGIIRSYGNSKFSFFGQPLYCFPWQLHHVLCPPAMPKGSNFCTASLTLTIFQFCLGFSFCFVFFPVVTILRGGRWYMSFINCLLMCHVQFCVLFFVKCNILSPALSSALWILIGGKAFFNFSPSFSLWSCTHWSFPPLWFLPLILSWGSFPIPRSNKHSLSGICI